MLLKALERDDIDLSTILGVAPDVLVLTNFDYDAGAAALGSLQTRLQAQGLHLPHRFAERPNTGLGTGLDLDGDGLLGGPRDAQGFGWFAGQGGMAVLARWPLSLTADFTATLWKDVPDSAIAVDDPGFAVQRLSSSVHWQLKVAAPGGGLTLLTLAATPPVFDGPEDRNGRRNRDEVLFWTKVLDGALGDAPDTPVVLIGNFNVDPDRGDGRHEAARRVLSHSRLRDPHPGLDTVTWDSTGPMRVSYVLPDKALTVTDAGITRPSPDPALGPHRLVWVDIARP